MALDDLTPVNFIARIKSMDEADRVKITKKRLMELIMQFPEPENENQLKVENLHLLIQSMKNSLDHVTEISNRNKEYVAELKSKNRALTLDNQKLLEDVEHLKEKVEDQENVVQVRDELRLQTQDLQNQIHELSNTYALTTLKSSVFQHQLHKMVKLTRLS